MGAPAGGEAGAGPPLSRRPAPQDTLRECAREDKHCLSYLPAISPIYFVTFVLVAQFVLVNVVVAVLMKHLEESNKEAREDAELDAELELEVPRGPPACPRPAAPRSPDAPGLLVVRKVSVSRMLSLPNDSYMFRPVAPASAPHPHPLREADVEPGSGAAAAGKAPRGGPGTRAGRLGARASGMVVAAAGACFPAPDPATSAHSPPVEPCTSLQVSATATVSPARDSDTLHALSPRGTARSPSLSRLLCRQVGAAAPGLGVPPWFPPIQSVRDRDPGEGRVSASLEPEARFRALGTTSPQAAPQASPVPTDYLPAPQPRTLCPPPPVLGVVVGRVGLCPQEFRTPALSSRSHQHNRGRWGAPACRLVPSSVFSTGGPQPHLSLIADR